MGNFLNFDKMRSGARNFPNLCAILSLVYLEEDGGHSIDGILNISESLFIAGYF